MKEHTDKPLTLSFPEGTRGPLTLSFPEGAVGANIYWNGNSSPVFVEAPSVSVGTSANNTALYFGTGGGGGGSSYTAPHLQGVGGGGGRSGARDPSSQIAPSTWVQKIEKKSIACVPLSELKITKVEDYAFIKCKTVKVEIPEDAPILLSNPFLRYLDGLFIKVTLEGRRLDYKEYEGLSGFGPCFGHFVYGSFKVKVQVKDTQYEYDLQGMLIPSEYLRG